MFAGHGKQESHVLGKTVKSVLKEAASHGMQSIAMPLIGHGEAGWPAKLAAQIHVEQVLRFFKSRKAGLSLKVLRRHTPHLPIAKLSKLKLLARVIRSTTCSAAILNTDLHILSDFFKSSGSIKC